MTSQLLAQPPWGGYARSRLDHDLGTLESKTDGWSKKHVTCQNNMFFLRGIQIGEKNTFILVKSTYVGVYWELVRPAQVELSSLLKKKC